MSTRIHRLVTLVALLGLFVTGLSAVAVSAQEATPTSSAASPRYEPPPALPEGELSEDALRQHLIAMKQTACADLGLIAGILVSTGVLPQVPPMISGLTGMPVDELEARETAACQEVGDAQPDEEKSTIQLLNEASTAQWLVQIHLGAMDHVMMQNPTFRPIAAEGCFAAFFEMHNLNIEAMRQGYLDLVSDPTLEEGQALATFWTEVLQPHARAEDATMWDLARSIGDPNLTRSADLVEAEHQTIEDGIAAYLETLEVVEAGEAEPGALVPLAEQLRIRTELHFGKEEITVVRPMQERLSSEEFQPVMEAFDQELGDWLGERGWSNGGLCLTPTSPCGGTWHREGSPAGLPSPNGVVSPGTARPGGGTGAMAPLEHMTSSRTVSRRWLLRAGLGGGALVAARELKKEPCDEWV